MHTLCALFGRLVDADHLEASAARTVRGKRRRPDVADFLFRRETVLAGLRRRLIAGNWRHADFRPLFIHDPKPRLIARADIEERVVHTALVRLMEPAWMVSVTDDDFACRAGYGTHRARIRLLELVRRYRWFLHLDVRAYFPSIDLGILRQLLARRIRDPEFLAVLDEVLVAGAHVYTHPRHRAFAHLDRDWPPPGCGLPIGAYTSQFLAAHVYLLELDHWIKRVQKVPGYARYVDDLFLFADRRGELARAREEVARWLWVERRLLLKSPEARVRACCGHLDALGCRIERSGIEPLRRRVRGLGAALACECRRDRHGGARVDPRASVESRLGEIFCG